ncbi:MAG: hypothetical protein FWF50_03515 [Defluviitaleaceae bacterium]|nr:hypothetical protein [Defluviitaleaceae bacterium]
MDKTDEQIIALKNQQEKKDRDILKDGAIINDNISHFKEVSILDSKLIIEVPNNFEEMNLEIAKIKYPSEQRPQYIMTNPSTSTNIGLSLLDHPINETQVEEGSDELKRVLKATNPAIEFYKSGVEKLEDLKISWFEYKSYAIDDQMYNIMFVSSYEGKFLHGNFNCRFSEHTEWREPALTIIKSLKINKKEELK